MHRQSQNERRLPVRSAGAAGSPDPPVVAVLHGPHAAVSIPQIVRAAAGLCRVRLFFSAAVAAEAEELVAFGRRVAETAVYEPGNGGPRFRDADVVDVAGVVTYRDGCVEDAEALAGELGLPGSATGPRRRWHKDEQRTLLREAGLSRNESRAVASLDDLVTALRELGAPGFLKPLRGTGSHGVVRIADARDAIAAATRAWAGAAAGPNLYETEIAGAAHPMHRWLGDYVSVETASCGSRRWHFAVTDKLPSPDRVREAGDVAPTTLDEEWAAAARDATGRALDALDVRDRVTHTELKLTTSGPEVLEVNGRLGGEVEMAQTRIGTCRPARIALEVALRRVPDASARPRELCVLALFYPAPCGTFLVARAPTTAALRELEGLIGIDALRTNGAVVDTRGGTASSLATVWLEAVTIDELRVRLASALRTLSQAFELDPPEENAWVDMMLECLRIPSASAAS